MTRTEDDSKSREYAHANSIQDVPTLLGKMSQTPEIKLAMATMLGDMPLIEEKALSRNELGILAQKDCNGTFFCHEELSVMDLISGHGWKWRQSGTRVKLDFGPVLFACVQKFHSIATKHASAAHNGRKLWLINIVLNVKQKFCFLWRDKVQVRPRTQALPPPTASQPKPLAKGHVTKQRRKLSKSSSPKKLFDIPDSRPEAIPYPFVPGAKTGSRQGDSVSSANDTSSSSSEMDKQESCFTLDTLLPLELDHDTCLSYLEGGRGQVFNGDGDDFDMQGDELFQVLLQPTEYDPAYYIPFSTPDGGENNLELQQQQQQQQYYEEWRRVQEIICDNTFIGDSLDAFEDCVLAQDTMEIGEFILW